MVEVVRQADESGTSGPHPVVALLVAFAAGAVASVLAAAFVFMTIAVFASTAYIISDAAPAVKNARIKEFAVVVTVAAVPVVGTLLRVVAGWWVGRRSTELVVSRTLAVIVGTLLVGLSLASGFGSRLTFWDTFLAVVTSVIAVAAGMVWGGHDCHARQMLGRLGPRLRLLEHENEVLAAVTEAHGGDRVYVRLYRWAAESGLRAVGGDRGRLSEGEVDLEAGLILRKPWVWSPGSSAKQGGKTTAAPFQRGTLHLRLLAYEGQPLGVLSVTSRWPWVLVRLRRRLWQAAAELVAGALQELDQLDRAQSTARQREREQIADVIHDTLAQDLIGVILHLEALDRTLQPTDVAAAQLATALNGARACLDQARHLVWSSQTPGAASFVVAALEAQVRAWADQTAIPARFCCDADDVCLDPNLRRLLLRVAHEGLTNVRKHARASEVVVTLSCSDDAWMLDIHDNGVGFDPSGIKGPRDDGSGFGLQALRDRLQRLGGHLVVESRPGQGTTLGALVPATASAKEKRDEDLGS